MSIMSSRDHWRITTAAIQLEMERISGLLQKSAQFQSRTSAAHSVRERSEAPTSLSRDAGLHKANDVSERITDLVSRAR